MKKVGCDISPPITRQSSTNPREVRAMRLFFLAYRERREAGLYRPRTVTDALLMLDGRHEEQDTAEGTENEEDHDEGEYTDGSTTLAWWRTHIRSKKSKGKGKAREDDEMEGIHEEEADEDSDDMEIDSNTKTTPQVPKQYMSDSEEDSGEEASAIRHAPPMRMTRSTSGGRAKSLRVSSRIRMTRSMGSGFESKRAESTPATMSGTSCKWAT